MMTTSCASMLTKISRYGGDVARKAEPVVGEQLLQVTSGAQEISVGMEFHLPTRGEGSRNLISPSVFHRADSNKAKISISNPQNSAPGVPEQSGASVRGVGDPGPQDADTEPIGIVLGLPLLGLGGLAFWSPSARDQSNQKPSILPLPAWEIGGGSSPRASCVVKGRRGREGAACTRKA